MATKEERLKYRSKRMKANWKEYLFMIGLIPTLSLSSSWWCQSIERVELLTIGLVGILYPYVTSVIYKLDERIYDLEDQLVQKHS